MADGAQPFANEARAMRDWAARTFQADVEALLEQGRASVHEEDYDILLLLPKRAGAFPLGVIWSAGWPSDGLSFGVYRSHSGGKVFDWCLESQPIDRSTLTLLIETVAEGRCQLVWRPMPWGGTPALEAPPPRYESPIQAGPALRTARLRPLSPRRRLVTRLKSLPWRDRPA